MLQGIFFGSLMVAINPVVLLCGGEGVVGGAFRIPELHKIEPLRDPPTPLRALHTQRQGSLSPGTWASRLAIPVRSGGPWDISTQASTAALSVWQHLGGLEMNVLPPPLQTSPPTCRRGTWRRCRAVAAWQPPACETARPRRGRSGSCWRRGATLGVGPLPDPRPPMAPKQMAPGRGPKAPTGHLFLQQTNDRRKIRP